MVTAGVQPDSRHGSMPPPLTDADIVLLAQQQPQTGGPLPPCLTSPDSHQTLIAFLCSRSISPSPSSSVSEYAIALLSVLSRCLYSPSASSILSSFLLAYIDLFNTGKIPHDSNSFKTIQLFNIHLQNIPIRKLPSIAESIISYLPRIVDLDDAQLLELLPRCLEILKSNGNEQFVNSMLERILACDWSKVLLVKMVSIIREFSFMDKNRGRELLDKVFRGMMSVDLQDIPSLTYQLLVAASKGFSKREVIEGIVMFFELKTGPKVSSTMRHVEGTVLLHLNFAVKQDPSLGQEVVGLMKSDIRALNHFSIVVLLSVARVRRFSESCMRVLKMAVLSAYRDHKVSRNCKWLPENLKEEYLQRAKMVEKAVLRAVDDSNYGREHVVPSIVQFGFLLLESVKEDDSKRSDNPDDLMGIEGIGIEMLKILFEAHDMSRTEIIEQCKFHILSSRPEHSKTIVRLLGIVVLSYPHAMLEHVSRLKELLDYFTFLDSNVATYLMTALLPFTKFSRDLQDYIILVVRKAMFSREDAVRVAAINAIIDVILADKQSKKVGPFSFQDSSSQASCSQPCEIMCGGNNNNLFLELSGLLQRCLYQQAKVREILYHGLVKIVLVDPLTSGPIFDFLLPHFLRFFQEDADFGLNIGSCVKLVSGKICIDEPFDWLLSCISWVLLLQPHGKSGIPDSLPCFGFSLSQENEAGIIHSGETFSSSLQKIRNFLRSAKMEGILGEVHDTGSVSFVKEKKQCCAFILSGIIEVVLNNIATELEKSTDGRSGDLENEIIDFVILYDSLQKDICTSGQGNGIRRGSSKITASDANLHDTGAGHAKVNQDCLPFMGTSSIYRLLLMALKLDNIQQSNDATASRNHSQGSQRKVLVGTTKLISFSLNASLRQIKSSPLTGKSDPTRTLIYGEIMILGPPLLKLVWLLRSGPSFEADQKKKESKGRKDSEDRKDCIHLALICLRELLKRSLQSPKETCLIDDLLSISAFEHAPKNIDSGDDECRPAFDNEDQDSQRKMLFLQKVIKPLLSELLSVSFFCEVQILCDIVLVVGDKLPKECRSFLAEWVVSMCKNSSIKDPKVAKCLAMLASCLKPPPDDLLLAEAMALEMLNLTRSEQLKPLKISEEYPIINQWTAAAVASPILQLVESVIGDMQWATVKLKTSSAIAKGRSSLVQNGEMALLSALEEAVYSRAEAVVKVLSPFMGMSLKAPQAEQILRLAERFYKQLALMSKLQIAPKGCKQLLPSLTFQKLVEITCKHLTVPLYNFVSQMQQNQLETNRRKGIINKIKRENRCIPDLIFHIENYEKYLIQLTKATKVNLLRHAKRSTSRDFRILEPEKADSEHASSHERGGADDSNSCRNESCERSEDDGGNQSDKVASADSDGRIAEENSESDGGDGSLFPYAKRAKMNTVVEDSDEEV
ncbi:hypothetical protein Nepgr_010137 [Nepenthes gracilis]|uniref:Fanconi anemia group I protein n=1 Tax=Nepenthes gracilis TaxID=150966 RepID=A0AAD3SCU2_NEPGR|nr:hypothetical protein Nepgr_010137 [Nepenthes gracilis]